MGVGGGVDKREALGQRKLGPSQPGTVPRCRCRASGGNGARNGEFIQRRVVVSVLRGLGTGVLQNHAVYFNSFDQKIEMLCPFPPHKEETMLLQLRRNIRQRRIGHRIFLPRLHARAGDEPRQTAIAFRSAREHGQWSRIKTELRAKNGRQPHLSGGLRKLHEAIESIPVYQRHSLQTQLDGARYKLFRLGRAPQEAIGAHRMQLREGHSRVPHLRLIRSLRQMVHRHRNGPRAAGQNPLHARPRQRCTPVEPHSPTP